MVFILILFLFCCSTLNAYDDFTINLDGRAVSVFADPSEIYAGTDKGLYIYDAVSRSLSEILLQNKEIRDLKSKGSSLFALAYDYTKNKISVYSVHDRINYELPDDFIQAKTFLPLSSELFLIYNDAENVLVLFDLSVNVFSVLSDTIPGFGSYEPVALSDFYITEPVSLCGFQSFYFIVTAVPEQILYVSNGNISTYSRCEREMCDFSVDNDHFFPWFAASLIRDDSKTDCADDVSFYFSSDNLIFYADFSELLKVVENNKKIISFHHYSDGFIIAEENRILFIKE